MSTTLRKPKPAKAASPAPAARASVRAIPRPTAAPDAALSPTAHHLLDTAERLYAERGIEAVSLREIVAASGQRNLSAAQYHFGTRDALLSLLLARRVHAINERRHARLDALEAAGRGRDIRALVEASTEVLAAAVRSEPWGPDYVRVTAQMLLLPSARAVIAGIDPIIWSGHTRVHQRLRELLPDLPSDEFHDRIRILNNETVYFLARWVHVHGAVTADQAARFDALVQHTVDFLAAGMAAPAAAPGPKPARRRPAARKASR